MRRYSVSSIRCSTEKFEHMQNKRKCKTADNMYRITGNQTNKQIRSRDGAEATLEQNSDSLTLEEFLIEFKKKSDLLNVIDYKHTVKRP